MKRKKQESRSSPKSGEGIGNEGGLRSKRRCERLIFEMTEYIDHGHLGHPEDVLET